MALLSVIRRWHFREGMPNRCESGLPSARPIRSEPGHHTLRDLTVADKLHHAERAEANNLRQGHRATAILAVKGGGQAHVQIN